MNDVTLTAMEPSHLSYYLRSRGWSQQHIFGDQDDPKGALWAKDDGSGDDVWLPYKKTLGDYDQRLQEAWRQLAAAEHRPLESIINDVLLAKSDCIKLRANHPSSRDGTIPFEDGVLFLDNAKKLIDASASATCSKQSYFPGRRPQAVYDFMRNIRLGQTEKGSYVLNIISHLAPSLKSSAPDGESPAHEPFERQVITTMATSLNKVYLASKSSAASGDFLPFRDSVKFGVTGNLCEAIVGLGKAAGRAEISFDFFWSPARERPNAVPQRIIIGPDCFDIIEEAARVFKETFISEENDIEGYVVNIKDNQLGSPSGRITIATSLNEQLKKIHIDLEGDDYKNAANAIRDGKIVRCSGLIEKEGNRLLIKQPKNFIVTEEE